MKTLTSLMAHSVIAKGGNMCAVHCSREHYNSVLCSGEYSEEQWSTVEYSGVQWSTVEYSALLVQGIVYSCAVQYRTVCSAVQNST